MPHLIVLSHNSQPFAFLSNSPVLFLTSSICQLIRGVFDKLDVDGYHQSRVFFCFCFFIQNSGDSLETCMHNNSTGDVVTHLLALDSWGETGMWVYCESRSCLMFWSAPPPPSAKRPIQQHTITHHRMHWTQGRGTPLTWAIYDYNTESTATKGDPGGWAAKVFKKTWYAL